MVVVERGKGFVEVVPRSSCIIALNQIMHTRIVLALWNAGNLDHVSNYVSDFSISDATHRKMCCVATYSTPHARHPSNEMGMCVSNIYNGALN